MCENYLQSDHSIRRSQQISGLQHSWEAAVADSIASIASFDPRQPGIQVTSPGKQIYDHKVGKWLKIEDTNDMPTHCEFPPEELRAFEALKYKMGERGVDIRPHLYCKISQTHLLLDSGSEVSAVPPDPGDVPDPSMTLKAVNGSKLNCYGHK